MADTPLSSLTAATGTPDLADEIYVERASATPTDQRGSLSWLANLFATLTTTQTLQSKTLGTGCNVGDGSTPIPVFPGSMTFQGGAVRTHVMTATKTISTSSLAAQATTSTDTVTVTGAVAGDMVTIGVVNAADTSGLYIRGYVSASDTVTIRVTNISGSSNTTASINLLVKVERFA